VGVFYIWITSTDTR